MRTLKSGSFQRLAIIGAICWTALLGFWLSSGVAYLFFVTDTDSPAQQAAAGHRAAQFAVNGAQRPFIGLVFPVILAAAPLFAHRSRRAVLVLVGTMLLVLSILGSDSGGVFYLPAAVLLLLAAIPSRRRAPATQRPLHPTPRFFAVVKLAVMVSAIVVVCLVIGIALTTTMHFKSASSVFGAEYSLILFLLPNVLSFAISAWIMRTRWGHMGVARLVAGGFSIGVTMLILTLAFALLLSPFLRIPFLSGLGPRATMVVPGIIAAQMLRLSRSGGVHAAPPLSKTC